MVLMRHRTAVPIVLVIAALVLGLALPAGLSAGSHRPAPVAIQLLDVSDWHAQLDPISGVGGAAALSTYFANDRAAYPAATLTLTGGDAYGGSPPLSSYFNEEPAVKAMKLMGFDADTFGNHNFDRGISHLQEMIDLAEFQYVSANLVNRDENLTGVKDFEIFDLNGVKVAVIGITNPEAPSLVFPGNFGTIEVTDPVPAANKARAAAKRAGAQVFVAITHLGVTGVDSVTGDAFGPLIDFANNVGGFDVIFGDHTDVQYEGVHNNALVVENRSRGVTYSKTLLTVDPRNGRVISRDNAFVSPVANAVTPDPVVVEMLEPYREALAAVFDQPIGVATETFPRGGNIERVGEVAIGNLIADAIRVRYGTQFALINGGGIRAPLPSSYTPADTTLERSTAPYDLVVGDAYTVLPFGNVVVTRTVTGAQLWAALEHGVAAMPAANGRFPQISGFEFTYDASQPVNSRVQSVASNDGTPIPNDGTTYTLALPDFVNAGGDGYTMFADGSGVTRDLMAEVLKAYVEAEGIITPTIDGRITRLDD